MIIAGDLDNPLFLVVDVARIIGDNSTHRNTKRFNCVKIVDSRCPKHPGGVYFFTEEGLRAYLQLFTSPRAVDLHAIINEWLNTSRNMRAEEIQFLAEIAVEIARESMYSDTLWMQYDNFMHEI